MGVPACARQSRVFQYPCEKERQKDTRVSVFTPRCHAAMRGPGDSTALLAGSVQQNAPVKRVASTPPPAPSPSHLSLSLPRAFRQRGGFQTRNAESIPAGFPQREPGPQTIDRVLVSAARPLLSAIG